MLTVNPPCEVGGWDDDNVHLNAEETAHHRALMKIPHVRWEGSSNYFKAGCPAGIEKLYISPYGDVMPCNFTHIGFGNLTEKPLAVIWNDILTGSPFNKIHDHCLVAEDAEFQRVYLEPVVKSAVHPLPVEQHPAFQG
ncbi:MAG: SPASM domain-containing protein [Deltaproteobacteria bacterium]|nr:SPASM domain-containing protein [Deltaproteobacteria bacterium]